MSASGARKSDKRTDEPSGRDIARHAIRPQYNPCTFEAPRFCHVAIVRRQRRLNPDRECFSVAGEPPEGDVLVVSRTTMQRGALDQGWILGLPSEEDSSRGAQPTLVRR